MQRALGTNWPTPLQCGRHSSASSNWRRESFLPPDLATVVSIWIASRSDRLLVNGSGRGRSPCRFHSGDQGSAQFSQFGRHQVLVASPRCVAINGDITGFLVNLFYRVELAFTQPHGRVSVEA
jgi:hypothetical protein